MLFLSLTQLKTFSCSSRPSTWTLVTDAGISSPVRAAQRWCSSGQARNQLSHPMRNPTSGRLLAGLLLGILAGTLVGGVFPHLGLSVKFLGDLFLSALLMLVVPLIVTSMIVGVTSLGDVRKLGPLGGKALLYFMGTTALAVLIGLALVTVIQPGIAAIDSLSPAPAGGGSSSITDTTTGQPETVGQLLVTALTRLVPNNLFMAMANADVLPLIVFSLIFGGVLTTIGERGQLVIRFFEGANEAVMKIVQLLMWVAPVGIGALIAGRLGKAGGFVGFWPELMELGAYAGTVVLGLTLHGFVVLPLLLRVLGRRPVWSYARNMGTALSTAFSTSSSSATLPMTMEGVTELNRVSPQIARFVLPLGATLNMNGTALYEAVAAVFIAQMYGVDLDAGHLIIVFLTATLAAVGAAGIPEAGLVTMAIVLKAVGLPLEGISLLLVIDWFLDRCRTTVNVWGDAVGAAVIERAEGEHVKQEERREETVKG